MQQEQAEEDASLEKLRGGLETARQLGMANRYLADFALFGATKWVASTRSWLPLSCAKQQSNRPRCARSWAAHTRSFRPRRVIGVWVTLSACLALGLLALNVRISRWGW